VALSLGHFGLDAMDDRLEVMVDGRYFRNLPTGEMGKTWWATPLALVFVSFTWWENFVEKNARFCGGRVALRLRSWKVRLHQLKQKTCIISSLWNAGIIVAFPFIVYPNFMYTIDIENQNKRSHSSIMLYFVAPLSHGLSTFVAYITGLLACKLCMQKFAYNLPLLLATPATTVLVAMQCKFSFMPVLLDYFWVCPEGFGFKEYNGESIWQYTLLVLFWLSQLVIAGHIWRPRQQNMDKVEK
jgi:chitin synthase